MPNGRVRPVRSNSVHCSAWCLQGWEIMDILNGIIVWRVLLLDLSSSGKMLTAFQSLKAGFSKQLFVDPGKLVK